MAELNAAALALGCPLNNLAQEMSASDEKFRERICAVYSAWSDGRGWAKPTCSFEVLEACGFAEGRYLESLCP